MAEYAAHVTTDVGEVTDEQLDELVERLAPWAGVPSMHGGTLSVQLTVEADFFHTAALVAGATVFAEVEGVELRGSVVGIEVLTDDEFERRLGLPLVAPDLISTVEVGELLDVSRQRVLQLVDDHPDFPEPVRRGRRGLLHSRAAVLRFLAHWDRSARPRHRTGASS